MSNISLRSDSQNSEENVQVSVRVRPLTDAERETQQLTVWELGSSDGCIKLTAEYANLTKKPIAHHFYDHLFSGSDNKILYEKSVKDLVTSAMEGYNATVFAYGQTASGKTYTMMGTDDEPGIIPNAVEQVFDHISQSSEEREFLLRVSYLEIYNENIRDLLNPDTKELRVHEDKKRGVYVSPLKEEIVTSQKGVFKVLSKGQSLRHTAETDFNARSSRSHTIFQMIIESRAKNSESANEHTAVQLSCLNLIDLAGSEKASTDAERRKEGAYINKSLLTLGTVIAKLTEDKNSHIPYRDSKLTRILQSSLSGNARVAVICTISPAMINAEESINTLKFASRVKRIVTHAETNEIMDDKALLQKYRQEILNLKEQLTSINTEYELQRQHELTELQQEKLKVEEEVHEQQLLRTALKERVEHLTKLILTSSNTQQHTTGSRLSLSGANDDADSSPITSPKAENELQELRARVKLLESQNQSLSNQTSIIQSQEEKISKLTIECQNLIDQNLSLYKKLEAQEASSKELARKSSLDGSNSSLGELHEAMAIKLKLLAEKDQSIFEKDKQIQNLSLSLQGKQTELSNLQRLIQQYTEKLSSDEELINKLKVTIESKDAEMITLKDKITSLESESVSKENEYILQIQTLQEKLDRAQSELETTF